MKAIRTTLAALLMGAMATGAFAAKQGAKDVECEASKAPEAASTQDRATVKAQAKADKSYECGDVKAAPKAASSKKRTEVKSEAAAAKKAGDIPKGEAGTATK